MLRQNSKLTGRVLLSWTVLLTVGLFYHSVTLADHDPLHTNAQSGQSAGQDALDGFTLPSVNGNDIEFEYQDGSTNNIDTADVFIDAGSGGDAAYLDSLNDNDGLIQGEVSTMMNTLSTEDSPTGSAYQTLFGSAQGRTHPDMSNDPIWGRTDSVLSGADPMVASVFTGCETIYDDVPGDPTHISDLRTCTKVSNLVGDCSVTHDYVPLFIRRTSGNGLIEPCRDGSGNIIPGCIDIWVGRVGNNYYAGDCTVHEENIELTVDNPNIITSATVDVVRFDDYMIIELNGNEVFRGPGDDVMPSVAGQFPPETCPNPADHHVFPCPCELSTSWAYNPGSNGNLIDVTADFQIAGPLNFKIRTSVSGEGEGFARIRAYYDPATVIVNESWLPPECINVITALDDGFCTGSYTCTNGPDIDGCVQLADGLEICTGDDFWNVMQPSPIQSIDKLCRTVDVIATCDWWNDDGGGGGDGCYIVNCVPDPDTGVEVCPPGTPQGDGTVEVCPGNNGESACTVMEDDPECAFVGSECMEGATGPSGECYSFEETYDCGYDTSLPGGTTSTVDCNGPIRCMGNDCVASTGETNPNFGKAAAVGETVNFAMMDSNCVGDVSTGVVCEIFKGEYYDCKRVIGGIADCCVTPSGASREQYLKAVKSSWEIASRVSGAKALIALGQGDVKGAWNQISEPAAVAFSATKESFISPFETAITAVKDVSIENAIDVIALPLTVPLEFGKQIGSYLISTYGQYVSDLIVVAGVFRPEMSATSFLAGMIVGANVYYVWNIVTQIIYACEDREYEAMMKKSLGSCTEVGDWCERGCGFGLCCIERREGYCCFNSPLSRIIMEQVKDYPAMDPESPDCAGLSVAELAAVDWSTIDLSEWTNELIANNLIPDSNAEAGVMYSMDATSSNEMATDFDAPNAEERVDQALNPGGVQTDLDGARDCIRQALWGTPNC